ncbi:MAG: hypothetical protein ACD_54C00540G0002 [uncultured bacterium]|nr:MAG: hypothetical protein ACD_54C00540G0002 [uncultured bacterium]
MAGAKVEGTVTLARQQPFQPADMRRNQIHHMHIIAHASAVRRRVILPEQSQRRAAAFDGIQHQRDQVGFRAVLFADLGFGVGPRNIEIAEDHMVQPVSRAKILQHLLNGLFRGTVRVDRVLRRIFIEQHAILIAIRRAGGRQHEVHTSRRHRRFDQIERAVDVAAPIETRIGHRFTDQRQRREMQHCDGAILAEGGIQCGAIQQIALHQRAEFHRFTPAGRQIVKRYRHIACPRQGLAGMRADIARPARDQHMLWHQKLLQARRFGLCFTAKAQRKAGGPASIPPKQSAPHCHISFKASLFRLFR